MWTRAPGLGNTTRMALLTRALEAIGISRAAIPGTPYPALFPPARSASLSDPRGLTAVYRAIQVITTAAAQLPIQVERGGKVIETPTPISFLDPRMTRSTWITHMVASLALHGNAYALIERDTAGRIIALRPLNPRYVLVTVNRQTHGLIFSVDGETKTTNDVLHAHLQPLVISEPVGLGPLQAARMDLEGARQTRDFAAQWFDGTGSPTGILSSQTTLTPAAVKAARNAWNGIDENGNRIPDDMNPSRIKVLSGFTYQHLGISPKDAQWIEAQEFSILQIARLFGIPSTLMLASPSGGSMSYSNIEQDWLAFTRFTLMQYLKPLEDALSECIVRGQQVRFNLEGLLRSDTSTRYSSYATALDKGFLTINEVRALEGRAPLPTTESDTEQ